LLTVVVSILMAALVVYGLLLVIAVTNIAEVLKLLNNRIRQLENERDK